MNRKINFNPGPAVLPLDALKIIQENTVELDSLGMSLLEMSHRSKDFEKILNDTKTNIKDLMNIPDNYDILFLQGGASQQFAMIPMNFLKPGKKAAYVVTGTWAKKALQAAKFYGETEVAATSENVQFRKIPALSEIKYDQRAPYLHVTSNNTIFGTQWKKFPDSGNVPMIADMSSDIMSRRVDAGKFAVIYAGAQKNLGPAGVTVVIMRKDLIEASNPNIPEIFNYKIHSDKNSLYNTPPVYAVYVVKVVTDIYKKMGGLGVIEAENNKKGEIVYGLMDEYPDYYRGTVERDSRSLMNATMRLPSEDLEKKFIQEASEAGLHGLKGHRSVGGIRISMYNSLRLDGIEKLADFMRNFIKNNR